MNNMNNGYNNQQSNGYAQPINSNQNFDQQEKEGYNQGQRAAYNQQTEYGQPNVKQPKQRVVSNINLAVKGKCGVNLLFFGLIAWLCFIINSPLAIIGVMVVAFIVEKNSDLNKVVASALVVSLITSAVVTGIGLIVSVIYSGLDGLISNLSYASFLYNIISILSDFVIKLDSAMSSLYIVFRLVFGFIAISKMNKGREFKVKMLDKYL